MTDTLQLFKVVSIKGSKHQKAASTHADKRAAKLARDELNKLGKPNDQQIKYKVSRGRDHWKGEQL